MADMWKRLIDCGVFDDSYSQRLNASFRYLEDEEKHNFSLKDLIQKGYFVFSYLSIDVEQDSDFAVMDLFRMFDRSGSGTVNIEEFASGIVEKLIILKKNITLLGDIVDELLGLDTRPSELANKLDKMGQNFEKLSSFRLNFKALAYVVKLKLRQCPTKSGDNAVVTVLTKSSLLSLLQDSVAAVTTEVQQYFHMGAARFVALLTENGCTASIHSKTPFGAVLVQQQKPLWDLDLPRLAAERNGLDAVLNSNNKALLSQLVMEDDTSQQGSDDESRAPLSSRDALLSSSLKSHRGGALTHSHHLDQDLLESELLQVDPELLQIMKGIKEVDESQLFLFQTAFRSVDTYFALMDASEQEGDPRDFSPLDNKAQSAEATTAEVMAMLKASKYQEIRSNYLREKASEGKSDKKESLGAVKSASTSDVVPSSAGYEYELVQDLLESQEKLRKVRMRMSILEMVQSQMLGNSSYYDELETEKSATMDLATLFDNDGQENTLLKRFLEGDSAIAPFSAKTEELNIDDLLGNTTASDFLPIGASTEDNVLGLSEPMQVEEEVATTYDSIISELSTLKASLAERSLTDYPLGYFLEKDVAIVSLVPASAATTANKVAPPPVSAVPHSESKESSTSNDKAPSKFNSQTSSVFVALGELHKMTKDMHDAVHRRSHTVSVNDNLVATIKLQEAKLNEIRLQLEQTEIDRSEQMSLQMELQILREKNQKLSKEENQQKKLMNKNADLLKLNKDLEEQLNELRTKKSSSSNDNRADNRQIDMLKMCVVKLEKDCSDKAVDIESQKKEIARLKNSLALSEERVKGSLQDQMNLHQKLQAAEEEAANQKSNVTKLTREIEDSKVSRHFKEDYDRKIADLQREINKRDMDMAEYKENAHQLAKAESELLKAEEYIEVLENRINEHSINLEQGRIAISQIEEFRERLKSSAKENRDQSLHIYGLESQLKELPRLQLNLQDLHAKLDDLTSKTERIPGLLSEIGQIRGNSRALVKTQAEQDRNLNTLRLRIKQLEKENVLLKNDNRSMQDLEGKLKEIDGENKKLKEKLRDMDSLKATVKEAEKDKQIYEKQSKTMKKLVRQSVLITGTAAANMINSPSNQQHGRKMVDMASVVAEVMTQDSHSPHNVSSNTTVESQTTGIFASSNTQQKSDENGSGGGGVVDEERMSPSKMRAQLNDLFAKQPRPQ